MKQKPDPQVEAIRAAIFYVPSWVEGAYVGSCPDAEKGQAIQEAYGDPRCIMARRLLRERPPVPGRSLGLSQYWAEQFEMKYLGRSTGGHIGRSILDTQPRFWEEVVSLAFRFEDGDVEAICRFYHEWGPLGYPPEQEPNLSDAEPWGWGLAALRWFREATTLLKWIQDERTDALWECFGEDPRTIPAGDPEAADNIFLRKLPFNDFRDYRWRCDTPILDQYGDNWVSPRNEAELYRAAFALLGKAVSLELQKIPLRPLSSSHVDGSACTMLWGFHPAGAFHAAFLQWFFQRFAGLNARTCAAEKCNNLVLPPQKKFCSPRCEQRTRTANQRAREAMAVDLHERRYSIGEIRREIGNRFGHEPTEPTVRGWIVKSRKAGGVDGK